MDLRLKFFLIIILVCLPIYFFRLQQKLKLPFQEGNKVKITTKLTQEPTIQGQNQVFKVKGIRVKTSKSPAFHYGDQLQIIGHIELWQTRSFFPQYQIKDPQITRLQASKHTFKLLYQFRAQLEQIINQVLPEPHASLLIGIVLGIPRSLGSEFYQALKITGTLHIVVASGMNISLVAGNLKEFLAHFLGRKMSLFVSLLCILIYSVIAGFNPPIVRASLMAAVLYLSQFIGRETEGIWILILAGVTMLFFDPLLLFDTGFQLSFSATSGLILIAKDCEKIFQKIPFVKIISGEAGEAMAAIIFTFPILTITFGHFNPLSILPNIFVVPIIPYIFYLGLIIMFFGFLISSFALILAWFVWLPLTYMIQIINFFGQFKLFYLNLPGLSWIFALGYYLMLTSLLLGKKAER